MQAGSLAARTKKDLPTLEERVEAVEAALSVERATLSAKKEKARESLQELEIACTIATDKEQELERAHRAKLAALEKAAIVKADLEVA